AAACHDTWVTPEDRAEQAEYSTTKKNGSEFGPLPVDPTPAASKGNALPLGLHLALAGLGDAPGLPLLPSQIEELRSANLTLAGHFDPGDGRRLDREDALHADALRDLAHGERGAGTAASPIDDDPLEHLGALLVPFDHPHVDPDRVAGAELGHFGAVEPGLELLHQPHDDVTPLFVPLAPV